MAVNPAIKKTPDDSQPSPGRGNASLLADLFRFLALSLRYPDKNWLNENYFIALDHLLTGVGSGDESRELTALLRNDPNIIETLQIEYTRLFINAPPHAVAPPYASVYMPGEGTIMAKSTEMVREFYRRRNFDLAPGCEVADHIIYELEFLGLLAESEEPTDAEIFLEQFFRPWFGSFQTRVINGANHKFYIILVGLIDFFTREEK